MPEADVPVDVPARTDDSTTGMVNTAGPMLGKVTHRQPCPVGCGPMFSLGSIAFWNVFQSFSESSLGYAPLGLRVV